MEKKLIIWKFPEALYGQVPLSPDHTEPLKFAVQNILGSYVAQK